MKCTRFSGIYTYPNNAGGYSGFLDYFTIVGKDGPKDFIMSMRRVGNCVYEGDAWVGSKHLSVMLWIQTNHLIVFHDTIMVIISLLSILQELYIGGGIIGNYFLKLQNK